MILFGCAPRSEKLLSGFDVFCEMVASDAKPVAFSHPMSSDQVDQLWKAMDGVAKKYNVSLYRETDFPVTLLFPRSATEGKEVVIIYRGLKLNQYLQLKQDIKTANTSNRELQFQLARRMGRLLGYSPNGINQLLMKQTDFRTLASFGVERQITHLYYEEIAPALDFYSKTLGLKKVDDSTFVIGQDAWIQLHTTTELHPADQPKSTAIALLTDQLPQWYDYLNQLAIPIKYTYKPKSGGPHDGFVAIDPGGYLLEFEQFKQHPENELFMAVLQDSPNQMTDIDSLSFYGSITWTYHKDLLKVQNYYEQTLGFQMVADQGWTKIFQTSATGFIGLVDERRGMMDYADDKAVELEWKMQEFEVLDTYASSNWTSYQQSNQVLVGPEGYWFNLQ